MGQSLEEIQGFLRRQEGERIASAKQQLQHQAHVGKVVSELLVDPKWEMYARHILMLKEYADAESEATTQRVMNAVDQQSLLLARVAHAKARATAAAYDNCLKLVTELVKTGQIAAEKLDG